MKKYKLYPLKQAEITGPLGAAVMLEDMRTFATVPVFIYYIEGADKNIVVDAGIEKPGPEGILHGFPVKGGGEEGLRNALKEVDLTPEDVDILILTHLHFDHCANAKLFKNARIYVQKREWEIAFNSIPSARILYDQKLFVPLERMDLILVDRDYNLMDGIDLIFIPGHTEGSQGVAVSTEKGTAVIIGDLADTNYNFNPTMTEMTDLAGKKIPLTPRPDLPFVPNGLHINLREWYDSMWKVVRIASSRNLIYTMHEPSLLGKVLP